MLAVELLYSRIELCHIELRKMIQHFDNHVINNTNVILLYSTEFINKILLDMRIIIFKYKSRYVSQNRNLGCVNFEFCQGFY